MRRSMLLSLSLSAALLACQAPTEATPDTSNTTKSATLTATASNTQGGGAKTVAPPPGPKPGDIPAPEDVAAPPADAQVTPSGLASKELQKGTGTTHPAATDKVLVHYTGWTKDGRMFDSSVKRGEPIEFPLNGVIKGWTEGVQLMVEGEKRRFWIPGPLAYGDGPSRGGRPTGQLTFDVELLKITVAPPPPEVPKDVAEPPKDAIKLKSGLAYKVLTKGTGTVHPKATDKVKVHYSGWTKDGKMFDSSVTRGEPISFPLDGVIKGWTEGVQLMVQGEKTRFWIPADLAYGENPGGGKPGGQLTFDIELLGIQ
ncbi:MAG: FKBP-type peptidyl-prolyl cis-trans isomerase [Polyangiaceae bacterium]